MAYNKQYKDFLEISPNFESVVDIDADKRNQNLSCKAWKVRLSLLHRVRTTFCLRLFRWKVGTMNFPRGKLLLFRESKVSVEMLGTPCAF